MPDKSASSVNRSARIQFSSIKLKRLVRISSWLEFDFVHLLDFEENISFFEEWDAPISYQVKNKIYEYKPAFHYLDGYRELLVDCVYASQADHPENKVKYQAAVEFCSRRVWEFILVTDAELYEGYRLRNIKALRRYALHPISPQITGKISAVLMDFQDGALRFRDILALVNLPEGQVIACVMQMAYFHQVKMPLDDAPISHDTWISL